MGVAELPEEDKLPSVESIPPKAEHAKVERAIATLEEFYSGPLPHPRMFAQFEKILPGSAERILAMAEKQQAHRIFLEKTVIESDSRRSNLGLILGFIIYILFGVGSFYLITNGHSEIGVAFVILAIAVLSGSLGISVVNRRNQVRETSRNPTAKETDTEDED